MRVLPFLLCHFALLAVLCYLPRFSSCLRHGDNCAAKMAREIVGVNSKHINNCHLMSELQYSYSVQTAEPVDSLQSTTFSDVNNGLRGSFELDQSLQPSDTLLIILGGRFESRSYPPHTCQKLAICGLTVDGLRHRLRLNVTLDLHKSYTMKSFKFANGSEMCEAPQIRFFYTRSNASEMPLVQMAVRSCNSCSEFDNFKCQLHMYLRTSRVGRVEVRVMDPVFGDSGDRIIFKDLPTQNAWAKRSFEMEIYAILLQVDFYPESHYSSVKIQLRRSFYRFDEQDGTLQSQLCQPSSLASCPLASSSTSHETAMAPQSLLPALAAAVAVAAVAVLAAAATLIRHRLCPPSSRRLLLVFADAEAAAAEAVGRFRRELRATDVIKRGRLRIGEFVGLRSLTPDMAKNSRLIIFISNDAKFSDFQLDSLSADVCLVLKTVLTEKHRTLGFYIRSGAQPPFTSDWASLSAKCLGGSVRDARACVNSLIMTLCDIESV